MFESIGGRDSVVGVRIKSKVGTRNFAPVHTGLTQPYNEYGVMAGYRVRFTSIESMDGGESCTEGQPTGRVHNMTW